MLAKALRRLPGSEAVYSCLLIILVSALAYLPLIHHLGLYREDWYLIWSGQVRGSASYLALFQADRPFVGYVYLLTYPLLGSAPLNWHWLAFGLRLIGIMSTFWLLRLLWPEKKFITTVAALLFAVYPGYLQQPNAVNKTFWLTALACALVSLALTVYSTRSKHRVQVWLASAAAVTLTGIYLLIIEFYVSFEAVRLILLWLALQRQERLPLRASLVRLARRYLPYLLAVLPFMVWRIYFFQSTRPTTNLDLLFGRYASLPAYMAFRLLVETAVDFVETGFLAWAVPPYLLVSGSAYTELFWATLLGLLAAGLFLAFRTLLAKRWPACLESDPETPRTWLGFIWLGTAIILVSLLPMVLAGREVDFYNRWDHYTIQATLGVALLLVGLIYYALRPNLRLGLIAVLIGVSVGTHFLNAWEAQREWQVDQRLWWQLAWRVPDLKDNTLLYVNYPPGFDLSESYEAWAPANLIYRPQAETPKVAAELLNMDSLLKTRSGTENLKKHRGIEFPRKYENALVLSMPSEHSCVNVIDGQRFELSESEEPLVWLAAPYSQMRLALTGVGFQTPPATIFGPEPVHDWCYYFQKASYARQINDWGAIARLGDEAQELKLQPFDANEWMPFLEGYVNNGESRKARNIAKIIISRTEIQKQICRQLAAGLGLPASYQAEQIKALLLCQ
jgi:multisubunit Na+/H+ antiporter MnhG subunit